MMYFSGPDRLYTSVAFYLNYYWLILVMYFKGEYVLYLTSIVQEHFNFVMDINLTKELYFLLPVLAIATSIGLFRSVKKRRPFIVSDTQVPVSNVIQKSTTGIILEYKHHSRVVPAPEQSSSCSCYKVEEMYKHDFEQCESPLIRIPFSKN